MAKKVLGGSNGFVIVPLLFVLGIIFILPLIFLPGLRVGVLAFVMLAFFPAFRKSAEGAEGTGGSNLSRPNIVFVLADDMGFGDVSDSPYNADSKVPTSNFNALKEEGMSFANAHCPSGICHPTRYGLLTGRHPFRERIVVHGQNWARTPLIDENRPTLGGFLQDAGYQTAMIGKWHLGFEGGRGYDCTKPLEGGPVDRGFETYFGVPASMNYTWLYIDGKEALAAPKGDDSIVGAPEKDIHRIDVLPRLGREAVKYIEERAEEDGGRPFFLYVALTSPHKPWLPTEPFQGASGAGDYGDFVVQTDSVLGDVVDAVDRTGLRENTLIIATSDNGPQWFPKDVKKFDHRAAGPLRGMKGDAWEGGHRVPFVVRWPGVVEEDTESDQLFGLTDIYATFADILNRDLAPGEAPDSVSILPVLLGEDNGKPVREYLPIHGVSSLALLSNRWKFIPNRSHGGFFSRDSSVLPPDDAPEKQLYDLAEDLGEQNNLYLQRPDVARRMEEKLNEIRKLKHPEPAAMKEARAAEELPEEEQIISWPSDEGEVIYRVNCGSDSDYKTEKGVSWSADQEYKPGETDWGFTGGGTVYRGRNRQIQWTKLDEIYRHERYHVPGYMFHVEDGRYTVRLHFAETYRFFNVGERVFDVYINGENVLPDFDAIGETGKRNRAVDKVIDDIEPIDGRIEIIFKPKGSIINGIEIIKQ